VLTTGTTFSLQKRVSPQFSETQIAQSRVIGRTPAKQPTVLAARFIDGVIVDGRESNPHDAILIELPVFVAIRPVPMTRVVMPLVREADGHAITPGPGH